MDPDAPPPSADWLLSRLDSEAPGAEPPPPPPTLGPFQLGERLGRGAYSEVFAARDARTGREVALKLVRVADATSPRLERLRVEVEALRRLTHPGIVRVLDWGQVQGRVYLALERVRGRTLAARLRDEGPLSERSARELIAALAEAVEAAHQQGVLHRDLKPTNVLLDERERPRLADFGLAKLTDRATQHTHSQDLLGTPGYLAPEQAGGRLGEVGPATDVYGLGATLYACLSGGQPPVQAATLSELVVALTRGRPRPLSELRPGVDPALERLCLRCLELDPRKRYPSARALVEALAELGRDPGPRPRRRLSVGLGLGVLGGAALALVAVGQRWGSDAAPPAVVASDLTTARELRAAGDVAGALDVLSGLPESAEARWLEYELRRERPGDGARARGALERTLELDPQHAPAALALAALRLAEGRPEAARDLLARVPESSPEAPRAWTLRGDAAAAEGEFAAAADAYGRACAAGEPQQGAWADCLERSGAFAEAIDVARAALEAAPQDPRLHGVLTEALRSQGQLAAALAAAVAWREALPRDPDAFRAEGALRFSAGDLPQAEAVFRRGLELDPRHAQLGSLLAEVLKQQGRFAEALVEFDRVLRYAPQAGSLWNNRAGVLLDLGRFAEARASYDRALALDPHMGIVYSHRAVAWSREGLPAEALVDAREGVRRAPTEPVTHYVLAELLARSGETAEALDAVERSLSLDPQRPEARFLRANLLIVLERFQEGLELCQGLVRDYPRNPEVHLGLALALRGLGRLDEARASARRALELSPPPSVEAQIRAFLESLDGR